MYSKRSDRRSRRRVQGRRAEAAGRYLLVAALSLVAMATAYAIGDSYIARLPQHRGYHLVAVGDRVDAGAYGAAGDAPASQRPRRTVVIVADGLRRDAAASLRAVALLRERGLCADTDVGPLTVSRPVYTLLSSGLGSERTGARNNDDTSPVAVESIWQVAREAGLSVRGISELPWWQQLFPEGFDSYQTFAPEDDLFAGAELAELTLLHPVYVDEAGHQFGGTSSEYAAAVARLERELAPLLARIDLARDVVVFTADHGHTDAGGHGGSQPEVRRVLTCMAGRGVRRGSDLERLDLRALAPTLAVLLGIRFPRHMHASDDELDAIWEIVDPEAFPAAYLQARAAAIERFRADNRAYIAATLGIEPGPGWNALYRRERLRRAGIAAALGLAAVLLLAVSLRRRRLSARGAAASLLWMLAIASASGALYAALRGSFDFSSINSRAAFLRVAGSVCAGVGLAGSLAHLALGRELSRWLADQFTLSALAVALLLGHIAVFGWPLGMPLPGAWMFFLPFFASLFALVHAALALVGASFCALRTALRTGVRKKPPRRSEPTASR
ncbi:type I phosphodiesterase/nucleotide pyrophosphatase [Haliangium ochraceum DSM 14365]|uniref:Type I phosphodiesterase/nucleotide pyrophosphatase n=1 Tax=Haliangium ochraceum (strain DSM 14365 / JCM 11303 / SMP-2) TaxID=502025 RepID=D0LVR5_HALO1|nr:type I phosphodiesterase/nucleotide pyrophosphatase [Haliangium ochraceum DSM 14365]